MAQMKVGTYTNPSSGTAATNISFGFTVDSITVYNQTAGSIFSWNSSMADASYFTVTSGAYTSSNGFTPLSQNALFGPAITDVSNAASAVITASNLDQFSFAVGDTVNIVGVADDLTGTTLNLTEATVSAVDATTVTVSVNTSSGYSTYVSGGTLVRVSDSNGDPVATDNVAIEGLTFGTGVVGTDSDVVTYVAFGSNSVV
jgi:hypothetical protein